jgi:hypothetical protein
MAAKDDDNAGFADPVLTGRGYCALPRPIPSFSKEGPPYQ